MHKRMDKAQQGNVAAKTPSAYAREMNYDSIVHAPKALRFLIDIAGIDNVPPRHRLFVPARRHGAAGLAEGRRPVEADSDAIAEGNPRRLFARMK